MDCREFDEQVVRLEGIEEVAQSFVLVRLTRIADSDLNVFEFDYDLTMMIFFIDADERVLGRYGGRDDRGPDTRQSLAGLRYTMQAALDTYHSEAELPPRPQKTRFARQMMDSNGSGRRGCIHCHDVKEMLNDRRARQGAPNYAIAWRFPLPENLGLTLEVDRGNVVDTVVPGGPAANAGLKSGDVLESINGTRVRSFADAQYALDKAPVAGQTRVVWRRGDQEYDAALRLERGWRKTDIQWRPSMYNMVGAPRVFGDDLAPAEKAALGIAEKRMAFRQRDSLSTQARKAGIRPGDIILGFNDLVLEMDAYDFQHYVRREFLSGDVVQVNLIRGGKRIKLPMKIQ